VRVLKKRIKRIYSEMKKDVDLAIIMNATMPNLDMNFFYATGLVSGGFEHSALLLHPDGRLEILTSQLEAQSARKAKQARVKIFKKKEERDDFLRKSLGKVERVGINCAELTHKNFKSLKKLGKKCKFVDISEAVANARMVKDEEELRNIRKASNIASETFDELQESIKVGMREYELAAEISYLMQNKGSSGVAFSTIVGFGENSAEPHYSSGARKLKKGDFIVLDFGARYNRYCSDITRTLVMGKASKRQKDIYDTVLEANELAIGKVKEGTRGKTLYNATKKFIDDRNFKGRFTHGLGHGLGLSAHDGGALNAQMKITLKSNMVFTIEPGIYFPGFGGARIEDDIVVKKNGCDILTKADKKLIEL
jgi:Xaa-Pro dipeptidase